MKAEDLAIEELVDISEGNLSLHGRRLVLHPIHAFAQFRKDVLDMLGYEQARRVFTRFGYFWGQADAAALKRIFNWQDLEEFLRAGARLHTMEGIVQAQVAKLELDEANGRLHMEVVWQESGEAEEHLTEIGTATDPVCWKLVGYASGFASFCLGKSVYFLERQCVGKGDNQCYAVGKDFESWGDEIDKDLLYFEADDIKGNVERLSRELARKSGELARKRRQLDILKHKPGPYFVEGRSKALHQVIDLATRVAQFDSSVLITGETGVGKEVMARHIHRASHRADGSFVTINCGALPETLLESELFGYKAGSFTGAVKDRIGLFEQAGGGTIFLDEVGDISPAMQVKILRVLQEKEIVRLGENTPRQVDARVIAATNRDLEEAVAQGEYRDDLLYRLRVIEIEIPPLRERREDILPLARFLVEKLAARLNLPNLRLDATCVDYLHAYAWPGNVRELENAIERAAVLSPDGVIHPEYLPKAIQNNQVARRPGVDPLERSLAQVEYDHILAVLAALDGNRTKAARQLGISSATLWRKLKRQQP